MAKKAKSTVISMAKKAAPVTLGVAAFFLVVRYAGHLPVMDQVVAGMKGDTDKFNWFGFVR